MSISGRSSTLRSPGRSPYAKHVPLRRPLPDPVPEAVVANSVASAVADTHALVFHAAGGGALGPRAKACFAAAEDRVAVIYVPVAVIWEVSLLARAVRINLHRPVRSFFSDLFSNPGYQPHPLDAAQVFDADELRLNRDPFDALIVAAARDLGAPLITRDGVIRESGAVKTIW
jgi:PIN domain nuclease of toxin-antitoxin system